MDADTFLWLVLPLLAVAAGAIYQARRDRGDIQELKGQLAEQDARIKSLEHGEVYRQGAESVSDPETFDQKLLASLVAQQALNTQAIGVHGERLDKLESEDE